MAIYSRELLVHFRCGSCDGWWSIADLQARLMREGLDLFSRRWYCPWCGLHQTVVGSPTVPNPLGPREQTPPHPSHTTARTEPRSRGDTGGA
jgi:hypothetical protein